MEEEKELPKRKELRLKQYNYSSRGAYFITICTKNRKKLLSNVVEHVGVGALDDPSTPQIQLTKIGEIVQKNLLSSENITGVKIQQFVIMPNHIHTIIFLEPSEFTATENGSSRAPTPTNEVLPHVISTFKRFCNKHIGYNIFQRGYYEHIIRNRKDYEEHSRYIYENPINWCLDELYTEE